MFVWGCKLNPCLTVIKLSLRWSSVSRCFCPLLHFYGLLSVWRGRGSVQLTEFPLYLCSVWACAEGPRRDSGEDWWQEKIVSPVPRLRSFPFFPPHSVLFYPLFAPSPTRSPAHFGRTKSQVWGELSQNRGRGRLVPESSLETLGSKFSREL